MKKIIALLKSRSDAEVTAKTILEKLEKNATEIENRIPDVLVLAKDDTQSLTEPALEYMRGCRSFMKATSNLLTSAVKKEAMLAQNNRATDRIAALRREIPANWAFSKNYTTDQAIGWINTRKKR